MSYKIGDLAELKVTFTDLNSVATDPSSVTLTILDPAGVTTTPVAVHDSTGNYHYDLSLTQTGVYHYKWVGAGTLQAVEEGSLTVIATTLAVSKLPLPPVQASPLDLIDLASVKSFIEVQGDSDDRVIQFCITGFSVFLLKAIGMGNADGSLPAKSPLVEPVSFDEWYDGPGGFRLFLRNPPIQSVSGLYINSTQVTTASTTINTAGYIIDQNRKSIALRSTVFTRGIQNIRVQYIGGFPVIPTDLMEMAMRVVSQNYRRRQWIDLASKSIGASGANGSTSYRDWAMTKLDERVLLAYKRVAVV